MATDLLTLAPRPLPVLALRARFALGVAAMLLPPAMLIVLGIVVLDDLTERLSRLMGEVTHEIHPVVEVQERLLRTATLVEAVSRRDAAPDRDHFRGADAHAFNAMAEELGESLAEREALASRDGLTGLFNHRTFHANLAGELDRSTRFGHTLSLLLIDVDHFKRVNDSFGHQAGDAALKSLGQLLIRETRAVDCAARYGGEELAVLLPETDATGAGLVAERIRASIQAGPIASAGGAPITLTVTVGAASFPAHAADAQALVAAADAALYAGKRAGRNRVVLAGEAAA